MKLIFNFLFVLFVFGFGASLTAATKAELLIEFFKSKSAYNDFYQVFKEANDSLQNEKGEALFLFKDVEDLDSDRDGLNILYYEDRYDLSFDFKDQDIDTFSVTIPTRTSRDFLKKSLKGYLEAVYTLMSSPRTASDNSILDFKERIFSQNLQSSLASAYELTPVYLQKIDNGYLVVYATGLAKYDNRFNLSESKTVISDYSRKISYFYNTNSVVSKTGTTIVSSSGNIYRINENGLVADQIGQNQNDRAVVASFPDSSALLYSASEKKHYRISNNSPQEITFDGLKELGTANFSTFIDEEELIWIFDSTKAELLTYLPTGQLSKVTYLTANKVDQIKISGISSNPVMILEDGSFLFSSYLYGVVKFNKKGFLTGVQSLTDPFGSTYSNPILSYDRSSNEVFVTSLQPSLVSIWKLQGKTSDNEKAFFDDPSWRQFSKLGAQAQIDMLARRIAFYKGSEILEYQAVRDYLNFEPESKDMKLRYKELTRKLGLSILKTNDARTRETLRQFGQFTASTSYWETMQLYEKLVSENPEDKDLRVAMRDFALAYKSADILNQDLPQIDIISKNILPVFPALFSSYQKTPIGTIRIKNSSNVKLENLSASLNLKKFMDFPTETPKITSLDPGKEAEIQVFANLNSDILDLQEDMAVQAELTLNFSAKTELKKFPLFFPIKLYKRTALSWDRSAKLASFVTPNEQVITNFAHLALVSQKIYQKSGLPEKIQNAMTIFNALKDYGIAYIEDPVNPISKTLGDSDVIDTVRFPRQTLLLKSGDCDDTSALLASLFEAVNIETAIMTSPGHVFIAFNTGEPQDKAWLWTIGDRKPLIKNGTLWLPIETTYTEKGFFAAWKYASDLIAGLSKDKVEFIAISDVRKDYPPVPLGLSNMALEGTNGPKVRDLNTADAKKLVQGIYDPIVAKNKSVLKDSNASIAIKAYNQNGIALATFGKLDDALKWYEDGLKIYPEAQALFANAAILLLDKNQVSDAQAMIERGLSVAPTSVKLNYIYARICIITDQKSKGQKYYDLALKQGGSSAVEDIVSYYDPKSNKDGSDRAGLKTDAKIGFVE